MAKIKSFDNEPSVQFFNKQYDEYFKLFKSDKIATKLANLELNIKLIRIKESELKESSFLCYKKIINEVNNISFPKENGVFWL